ncbi:MAG TPA: helicase C-terminal domain-containing protein [Opitutaceae bacterium]
MEFSLDHRTASLSVGEFADFAIGPRGSDGGPQGIWRAQLGTHWHQELRKQASTETPEATFEIVIAGRVFHGGWTLTLTGRIDQFVPAAAGNAATLREIKTVTRALPVPEEELRADYPAYFAQLATYLALHRLAPGATPVRGELVFVEAGSGLAQTIAFSPADEALFRTRLEGVVEFLNHRHRARERLRALSYRPAFAELRPGQETTQAELADALARSRLVAFEAPTGFGKTGALLECALAHLRTGRFSRALYLTSKSTGQLQVMRTLQAMTDPAKCRPMDYASVGDGGPRGVTAWHVRNKGEHCVNHVFHCLRDACGYLEGIEARWPKSGLSRFYLLENEPRDLDSLRAAGREARVCPYEITRAALAFNDVWIGDYNYVFAPRNRGLFYEQPGFNPAETLLLVDEAHNLPSRAADAYSHVVRAGDARAVLAELDHQRPSRSLVRAWEAYTQLLLSLPPCDAFDAAQEDDLADAIDTVAEQVQETPLDYATLGPQGAELLWQTVELSAWLHDGSLQRLLWSPREGELRFTCLDAAPAIAETLRAYGGAVITSATLGLPDELAAALGVEPAEIVRVEAHTPWREGAYDIAYDVRVDTSYQHRNRHHGTTAATVEALHAAAGAAIAVFFPSYAYAEAIARALDATGAPLRVALQPRLPDLAAQTAWVEESLAFADALFLVLGSSFAEGIDLLGGRVTHAMVVGPALPEVNAVQRARLAACSRLGRDGAFRRVYQAPGIQKVNQALGRLVRAPGQHATVLLHCRRFIEPSYAALLARDYQFGATITTDEELSSFLLRKT